MVTMHKLISLGIRGKVGKWIYSFLTHRTKQVIVNKSFSKPIEVKSGVPQGSVLGPLIFLILIGDINKDVNEAFLSSFADDTRIGRQIGSQNDSEGSLCCVQLDSWQQHGAQCQQVWVLAIWTKQWPPTISLQVKYRLYYRRERWLKRPGCDYVPRWYLQKAHPNYGKNSTEPMLLDPQDLYDKGSDTHAYPVEITCSV